MPTQNTAAASYTLKARVGADTLHTGWVSSGLVVRRGQRLRITATGRILLGDNGAANKNWSTPGGIRTLPDKDKLLDTESTGALIAVIGLVIVQSIAIGEPSKDAKPAGPPEIKLPPGWTEDDLKAEMMAGTPGKMHERLAKDVGVWQGKCSMWMPPGGGEPMKSDCTMIVTSIMDEEDVRTALKDPLVGVGTDSGAKAEDGKLAESKSHPRAWGSFPRILGHYVRDEHLLTLEDAIRKMTSKAAARVHLNDRGVLRPGLVADIAIFDPATIRDVSTFDDPTHYAIGVKHVLVNGRRVVADGKITTERPGRPLRGPGTK